MENQPAPRHISPYGLPPKVKEGMRQYGEQDAPDTLLINKKIDDRRPALSSLSSDETEQTGSESGSDYFDRPQVRTIVLKLPKTSSSSVREQSNGVAQNQAASSLTRQEAYTGMAFQGIDLTADAGDISTSISWHDPHPIFVIVLVGQDETPFGIQKDLLCAQSPFYREEFANEDSGSLEHIKKLPKTSVDTFGCFQSFIYTGEVYDKRGGREIPDYSTLLGVWKLASHLRMAPLRVAVLNAMAERREKTNFIPNTALLMEAWRETDEGSGLRLMLIEWAAEHMRASPQIRSEFAKSLPREILSELVVVMADLPNTHRVHSQQVPFAYAQSQVPPQNSTVAKAGNKRPRKSEPIPMGEESFDMKPPVKKAARKSEPARKPPNRRGAVSPPPLSAEKELAYCADLINRMLSGPGFWTRLVGPFKSPVDPIRDNVPNYFSVVKQPMDLKTIKTKMDRSQYATAAEFESDVRRIFQNCYEYWTQDDGIWKACQELEKHFDQKFGARNRWTGPLGVKGEMLD